jgi:hypothetical protein
MKPLESLVLLVFIILSIFSCNKNNKNGHVANGEKPSIMLSSKIANRGQQITAEVTGVVSSSKVRWTVQPAGRNILTSSGLRSLLQFLSAGSYTVTASVADSNSMTPHDSSSSPITITDSIQYPSPLDTANIDTTGLNGTQLHLQPIWADSGLAFVVSSDSIYRGLPYFCGDGGWVGINGGDSLGLVFSMICILDPNSGSSPNAATTLEVFGNLPNGTHGFIFNFSGTLYKGVINVSDQTIYFTWNYSSGVTMSPLVVQKK